MSLLHTEARNRRGYSGHHHNLRVNRKLLGSRESQETATPAMALTLAFSSRFSSLPNQLNLVKKLRFASTAPHSGGQTGLPFPFPTHPRPTPHQIFHLQPGASQEDIKARCLHILEPTLIFYADYRSADYELVRLHHPDSTHSRLLPPAERHARFQAITAAHDVLRGKSPSSPSVLDPYREEAREVFRRRQFYGAQRDRRAEYMHASGLEWAASADDRWKDKLIILVGLMVSV